MGGGGGCFRGDRHLKRGVRLKSTQEEYSMPTLGPPELPDFVYDWVNILTLALIDIAIAGAQEDCL